LGAANLNVVTKSLTLIAALPQGAFDIVVNGLFGIAVAAKAVNIAMGIGALIQGVTLAMTALGDAAIGTRIGLALLAVQEKVVAAATVVMTAAQWALNVALDANPIGLVVIAIAALVAGLIIAYKHSETFRNIVNGAFHAVAAAAAAAFNWIRAHWPLLISLLGGPVGLATVLIIKNFDKIQGAIKVVGKWATWLWNNAFQPALSFIVKGIAFLLDVWGHMLSALGHVPGFGWAKDAGAALQNAADRARNLADNIGKIPTHKESTVVLNVVHNVVHTTGGHVPKFAKGVQNFGGGLAMVGEEGPELVTLPRGASVYPHGTGPGGVTVVVNAGGLVDPRSMAALIHKELLKLRRRDLGGAGLGLG
jgi:phage-related protein